MSDVKTSLFAQMTHLLQAQAEAAKKPTVFGRDEDRPAAQDAERHLFEREESFYWNWQYPGQW